VDRRDKWCSQWGRHGVDGLSGVALLNGGDDSGQVPPEGRVADKGLWPTWCWMDDAKIEP
jgi:hypothetical protein